MSIPKGTAFTLLSVFTAAPLWGAAVETFASDTTPTSPAEKVTALSLLPARFNIAATSAMPASMPFLAPFSLTGISLGGIWQSAADTQIAENGSGQITGSVIASSYRQLNSSTTVWGYADFTAGKLRDIAWSNSADYDLTGPYVFGDSVGGDLVRRQYKFSGGYAGSKDYWTWGVEAAYRAGLDYRARDPRDKIVVSDLKGKISASRRIGSTPLAVGLGGGIRVYNQTASVEFYNPLTDITMYMMTGLGTTYKRFSGNSGKSIAHTGFGWNVTASLFQIAGVPDRFYLNLDGGNMHMRQFLRDFNNLELTFTDTFDGNIHAGFLLNADGDTSRFSGIAWGADLRISYSGRKGTENILGPSNNSYPRIGERQNYTRNIADFRLSIPAQKHVSATDRIGLSIDGALSTYLEKTGDPFRRIRNAAFSGGMSAQWVHRFRSGLVLTLDGSASYRATSSSNRLQAVDVTTSVGQACLHNAEVLSADITSGSASASVTIPMKGNLALSTSLAWRCDALSGGLGTANRLALTVGIIL